jgi:hypothetical protein
MLVLLNLVIIRIIYMLVNRLSEVDCNTFIFTDKTKKIQKIRSNKKIGHKSHGSGGLTKLI